MKDEHGLEADGQIVRCNTGDGTATVKIENEESKTGDGVREVTVSVAHVDAGTVRCSRHDVKQAVRHRHINHGGAAVQKREITRCRIAASTATHLLQWIGVVHTPVPASAANVKRGARYERPQSRSKLYPLYKKDATAKDIKPVSKTIFHKLLSSKAFVDKAAETCCCGTCLIFGFDACVPAPHRTAPHSTVPQRHPRSSPSKEKRSVRTEQNEM